MADPPDPIRPQYDPQALLNSQPVIITVIDPTSYKVQFQNQTSLAKFGDISAQTCHEKIADCPTINSLPPGIARSAARATCPPATAARNSP